MTVAPGVAAWQVADAVPVTVVTDGVTVTPFAEAPPTAAVFWTLAVSVTACPAVSAEGGCAAKVTARPAGTCTAVGGAVVAEAESAAFVPAAVPLALAVKVSVPEPATVQVKE